MQSNVKKFFFILLVATTLHPAIPASMALIVGLLFAQIFGNPFATFTTKYTSLLLMYAIIGLGFGIDLNVVGQVGFQGIAYTSISIFLAITLGLAIGLALKIPLNTSLLLSAGTAICGGSAIAAVAAAIRAKSEEVSVALATVFLLNALALFIFPPIGHYLQLDQAQFGLWSALAIHDTSSVVGACLQYGSESLQVGTTVKLARTLWIVPLTLAIGVMRKNELGEAKIKIPWFILGFVISAALATWIPTLQYASEGIVAISRRALVLTLFLIGANITKSTFKNVGFRPLLQGFLLWVVVAASTLGMIYVGK